MSDSLLISADSFTVVSEMNPHDALTVRSTTTHATYQLVEYTDESTRDALTSLQAGESVRLSLSRVGRRGNALDVGPTALATGLVGGVAFLLGTGAILAWVGPRNAIVAVGTVGAAVGVGVELAVVALAGLSLGRLRTTG